jgi:hypothetical protein
VTAIYPPAANTTTASFFSGCASSLSSEPRACISVANPVTWQHVGIGLDEVMGGVRPSLCHRQSCQQGPSASDHREEPPIIPTLVGAGAARSAVAAAGPVLGAGLREGQMVEFEMEPAKDGKTAATNLKLR